MAQVKSDFISAGPMQMAGLDARADALPLADGDQAEDAVSIEGRIQRYVELAIERCGSAAALARELDVKPPTVSQWRTGRKKPDAINLMRIQDLAQRGV